MRPVVAALVLIGVGAGVGVSVACTNPLGTTPTATNTASTFTPVTGIEVDAQSLFMRQGCGTGAGQVYKYVVVVVQDQVVGAQPCLDGSKQVVGAGVYDCFTDAVFDLGGIGTTVGSTNTFDVDVDAFDAPTYAAQASAIGAAVGDLASGVCPANGTADRATLAQTANWITTCSGRQEPQVQSMVACGALLQN